MSALLDRLTQITLIRLAKNRGIVDKEQIGDQQTLEMRVANMKVIQETLLNCFNHQLTKSLHNQNEQ